MKERKLIIGVDIGATNIHMGVVDQGEVIEEVKIPTPSGAPEMQVVSEIITGIKEVFNEDVIGIGVGVPGLLDEEKGIVYDLWNIPSWKEVTLKKYLEEHFNVPVYMTNDANTFVLGEKMYGDGKNFKNFVGITLGSGFGAGIVINGKLYSGTLSSAGELADIPYLDGNIEDYCSGKFFRTQYGMTGMEVYNLAKDKDKKALGIYTQYGQHLGNAIKIILYVLSPEAIYLGGSISSSFEFFKGGLYEILSSFPFKRVMSKLIIQPSQRNNIAILGAAALVEQHKG